MFLNMTSKMSIRRKYAKKYLLVTTLAQPIWVPIAFLLSLGLNSTVIIIILKETKQLKHQITWILVVALSSVSVWSISTFLQLDLFTLEKAPLMFSIVALIGNIAVLIGLALTATFWRLLVKPSVDPRQLGYLGTLMALLTGFGIMGVIAALNDNLIILQQAWRFNDFINVIYILSITVFIRNDLKLILSENLSSKQREQIINLRNGMLFGFLSGVPIIIISQLIDKNFLALTFLIIAVMFFLVTRAYLINPKVAFVLPHRAYLLVIVDNGGTLKYRRNFLEESEDMNSAMLISMGLSAVRAMMSEFYNTPVKPVSIRFEERMIMFHAEDDYFMAVFTDRESLLVRLGMEQAARKIKERFEEKLPDILLQPRELEINEIIDEAFYFIQY